MAFIPFALDDIEQSIPARFAQQVGRHPERLAVKTRRHAWTYSELGAFAGCVARAIRRRRGDAPETVALLMDQGAPLVASILGVLEAGKIYVPLDHDHPVARLRWMLDDADTRLILATTPHLALAGSLATRERPVLNVDELPPPTGARDAPLALAPDALAYLFYTSGSTGTPKGVADTHKNVLHNIRRYTNCLRITADDRLTLLQAASFSGAVSSLFGALLNGAACFPFDLRAEGPARLAAWLGEERLTIYHSVPMIFRRVLAGAGTFPSVRVVRLEGDAASRVDADLFRAHFLPPCVLANGLGATETGLSCQYLMRHDTELPGGLVPIGFPTPDMDVLVVDDTGHAVGDGIDGEIAVRSAYLAPGYWKRPDLTASAFAVDPTDDGKRIYRTGDMGRRRPDGCLEYLGRKDFQFKVRGQRVDAAEVESALLALATVRGAVVTTEPHPRGDARVVAYVVPAEAPAPAAATLRRALATCVPAHMVPSAFVFLDALPVNDNGKVNRRALPPVADGAAARSTPIAPARDDVERQLIAIWEEELGLHPLGAADDFFEAGGDSLAAARVMVSIEQAFGQSLPASALAAAATVEQLASLIRSGRPSASDSTLVPIEARGTKPALFCMHDLDGQVVQFVALARHLGPDQPLYGVKAVGLDGGEPPLPTFEAMAARYLGDIRAIQPRGPYYLGGYCAGAVLAFEMARQLAARGEDVALLALLSISPLDFRRLMPPASWRRYRRHVGGPGFLDRARAHLARARAMGARDSLRGVRARAGSMASALARARGGGPQGAPTPRAALTVPEAIRGAFQAYAPQPAAGSVVVVLDGEAQRSYTPDAVAAYRGLTTGPMVVHVIPGAEHAMMKEPGARELAKVLRRHLG